MTSNKKYTVQEIENGSNELCYLKTLGTKPWEVSFYFNETDKKFYMKGAFGHYYEVCYVVLDHLKTEEELWKWVEENSSQFE